MVCSVNWGKVVRYDVLLIIFVFMICFFFVVVFDSNVRSIFWNSVVFLLVKLFRMLIGGVGGLFFFFSKDNDFEIVR